MNFLKTVLRILDFIVPALAAEQVYHFLSNPRVRKLRDFEEKVLEKAQQETHSFHGFSLKSYTWGEPTNERMLMVHGWEGQAGNFGALVEILVQKGYYIKAVDAPSHGYSSKGLTHMFEFSEYITELIKEFRPNYLISHSFGSVTSLTGSKNNPKVPVKKWLMVTTPHDFKSRIADIQRFLKVSDRTMKRVIKKIEKDTLEDIDSMNMEYFGKSVPHVAEIIIAHSKTDKILPIESAKIAHSHIPQSRLIELDGLGHYSILWSKQLKEIVDDEF